MFIDARKVQPIGLSWDDLCMVHGILGLTPFSTGSGLNLSPPFMNMASESALDANVFSLRLRVPRELAFGGVNRELFTGNITRVPLTHQTSTYGLSGRWQTKVNYLTVGSTPGIRIDLQGRTAAFSTAQAFILLPNRIASNLLQDLEFEDIKFMPPSISCPRRANLPDITFNLAGHNFTLTVYDYTFEWPMKGSYIRCVSAIMPTELPPSVELEAPLGGLLWVRVLIFALYFGADLCTPYHCVSP
ncbi:Vacuolar protease A [Varicellaria rhodocarpa]|nr:Vacuolar protease A [Varicellaria rhodocarpa]